MNEHLDLTSAMRWRDEDVTTMKMRRFAILPIFALSAFTAFVPAQASETSLASPPSPVAGFGFERLGDKDEKPRKPRPVPGPRGPSDGD